MNVNEISDSIAIVIVCQKHLPIITGDWLKVHNIITDDEWEYFNKNRAKALILPNYSRLSTGNLNMDCNEKRFQIMANDIALIDRMRDITASFIAVMEGIEVRAIGINAVKRISFWKADDGYSFGKHFMNLDSFNVFMREPKVRTFTIEDQGEIESGNPKKTITISSVASLKQGEENVPVVDISINNHFQVFSQTEVQEILIKANSTLNEFREQCQKLWEYV